MPKIIAKMKAEEKKKSSSASSQSAFQKEKQAYEQQKTLDIQAAKRASENFTRASTNTKYNANLQAYMDRLNALKSYGYDVSKPVTQIQQEMKRIQPAVQEENRYTKALQEQRELEKRKKAARNSQPWAVRVGLVDPNEAEMTFGVYDPSASERGRVSNVLAAGGKGWLAGQQNALGFALDPSQSDEAEMFFGKAPTSKLGEKISGKINEALFNQSQRLYGASAELNRQALEHETAAKQGLGKFGQTLVDTGMAGTQMLLDASIGRATGTGMASMGTRTFGQSAREALDSGATYQQAMDYGALSAAVELGTEKMFDVAKIFGGGGLDKAIEKWIVKYAKTPAGMTILRTIAGASGEGLEEIVSSAVNPLLRSGYDPNAMQDYKKAEYWTDMLHEGLVGALLGGIGVAGNVITGGNARMVNEVNQEALNARLQRADAFNEAQRKLFAGNTMQTGAADAEAARVLNRNSGTQGARDKAAVRSAAQEQYGAQAKAVESVFEAGTADAATFQRQFQTAYDLGKSGAALDVAMNTPATAELNELQRENAWAIGRDAGIREGTIKEEANENGETVRVRGSGERDAGQSAAGQVQQVEGNAGSYQEGRSLGVGRNAKDSAAADLRYSEEVKSARDLGIENGAVIKNLRTVDESSYTPEMREYAQEQAANGHKVTFVSGLIHAQDGPGGMITRARGMVNGNGDVIIQADNERFTAIQIGRHEDGHLRIARGEIDLAATKEAVRESMGQERFDRAMQDYAEAYAGLDMTPDEIWEEIVCDAQGEMNIFEGTLMQNAEQRASDLIRETKAQTTAGETTQERAPPEGEQKMSAELGEYDVYNSRAVISEETLDLWLSGSYFGSTNPNYAQAYITYMSPDTFLNLTTRDRGERALIYDRAAESKTVEGAVQQSRRQPIQLMIDHETGEIKGHEGRHRMVALMRAGVRDVPVLLFDSSNKYSKAPIDEIELKAQFNRYVTEDVQDLQPFSQGNRETLVEKYVKPTKREQIGEKYGGRKTVKFSYAGIGAENADIARLDEAKQMIADGVDAETVRQETGWFRGMDGKWRFEIPDDLIRVKKFKGNSGFLVDFIEHTELFDNYPDLEGLRVEFADDLGDANGNFSAQNWKIKLSSDIRSDFLDTLIHEIQHAIQNIEGFSPGTSAKAFDDVADKEARNAKRRAERAKKHFVDALIKDPEIIQAADKYKAGSISEDEYNAVIQKVQKGEKYKNLRDKFGVENEKSYRIGKERGFYFYRNTAGEIEARDVSRRLNFSPIERMAVPPDLGDKNTVFAEQKMSAELPNVDSEGKALTEQQATFFAESKVRTDDGTLKVMYRGGNTEIDVFDRKKSKPSNLYGRGFYFTDSEAHAKQYGSATPYYLNITHPLSPGQHEITKAQMRAFLEAVQENDEDYDFVNYGQGASVSSVLSDLFGKGDMEMLQDVNATAIGDFVAAVELFNEVNGTDYDGIIVPTETVAFRSEQIKRTDNQNPTGNPNVKFSRELDDEYLTAVRSGDTEKAQRMVDEAAKKAGYDTKAYHGTQADFTVFDKAKIGSNTNNKGAFGFGFYFSNNPNYAAYYNRKDGKVAKDGSGRVINAYLKIKNPFRWNSINTREKFDSFVKEFNLRGKIGWNKTLSEPRHVAGTGYEEALTEALQAKGFDGVVYQFHENGGKTAEFVVFEPEQIKSADPVTYDDDGNIIPLSERFNPDETDIRFSRETDIDQLARENRALQKETDELRKAVQKWKGETKRTTRFTLREDDVKREAKQFVKDYNSTADAESVAQKLHQLGELILNGENGEGARWSDVREIAEEIAEEVVGGERVMLNGDEFENFKLLTGILREKPLHISKEIASDILAETGYDNLRDFNRAHMGTVTLTTRELKAGDRTAQDAYYEMAEAMPGWFPEDVSEAEFVPRMLEVLEGLKPVYGMSEETSANYEAAVTWAANDVIDRVLDESIRQNPKTFADRAQAKYDKERTRLYQRIREVREQGNERVERTKREYAERSRKAIERMQARQEKQIADLKAKQKAKEQGARERKNTSATWHKIQRIAQQFRQMADKPQQAMSKHAPVPLARALAELAEQFQTVDRKRQALTLNDQIGRLENVFKEFSESNEADHIYYSDAVDYMLQQMKAEVFDVPVTEMTAEQLDRVYQMLKAAHFTITNANKFVHGQWLIDKIEAGRRWAQEIAEAAPLFKKGAAARILNKQLRPDSMFARFSGFAKNSIGEQIQKMFVDGEERMLRIQQDAYQHFAEFTESKEFEKLSKRGEKYLVDVGLKDENGNPVLLTRDMMLAVYMHLRSEDNLMGAAYGGLDVPDAAKYYTGDVATSYEDGVRTASIDASIIDLRKAQREIQKRIREVREAGEPERMEDLDRLDEIEAEIQAHEGEMIGTLLDVRAKIDGVLTDYEKRLIRAVDEWMQKSADYINEETMKMYGIEKANVEHYWPIHRNQSFVNTDLTSATNEINLENWGSLKERVKSHAPILLTGLSFEIDNHTRKMSQFCGFAAVQRDFQQIYDTRLPGQHSTLSERLDKKYGGDMKKMGTSAQAYIRKYMADISGESSTEKRSILAPIRQNLARATLSANFRVAMSQVASIPTAAAEVGWGNMAKGWARYSVKGLSAKQQAKLAAADPWFWQRSRGEGGMREFAEMRESNNALDRAYNKIAGTKAGKALLNWCQRFDMYATYTQWAMAEEWVKKNTDLKPDSEEFDAAVAAKYRDIIRRTQPNYTVTERSDLLRDTRESMKWATMYKTQSNQNLNILYEATARLHQYNRDFKNGKNGVTEQDVKEARAAFANAYTGVLLGGTVSFVLFRAAANAILHAVNGYRDDDDELTFESVLKGIMKETMGAIAGMFLLGSEIYDAVYSIVSGERYWGLTDSAIGAFDDVFTRAVNVGQKLFNSDKELERDDVAKLVNSLMSLLGIPSKNVATIANGVWNHIEDIQNGEFLSFEAGVNRTAAQETNRILNGYLNGEGDKVKRAWDELLELKGGDESKAQSTMKSAIRDAFLENRVTDKQAQDMLKRYAGMKADDAAEYLLQQRCEKETGLKFSEIKEAYLNGDISADKAISMKQKYGGMDAGKAKEAVGEWLSEKETGIAVDDIKDAYLDGDISRQQAIDMRVKYAGKTKEDAKNEALKWDVYKQYGIEYSIEGVKEALVSGEISEANAKEIWTKYGGKTEEDADELVKAANFKKAHPDVDLDNVTAMRVDIYEQYAPKGTNAAKFMEYAAQIRKDQNAGKYPGIPDGKGGKKPYSVMDDVARWINSLPITDGEKTALLLTYTNGKTTSLSRYTWS